MEISEGMFTNVFEQFLIINSSDKLHSRVLIKSCIFTQLFIELVLLYIGNQDKIFFGTGLHKATNHGLIVVFGYKATYDKVVIPFRDLLVRKPSPYFLIFSTQARLACIRSIGDIGRLWLILSVILLDIGFNILAIAD